MPGAQLFLVLRTQERGLSRHLSDGVFGIRQAALGTHVPPLSRLREGLLIVTLLRLCSHAQPLQLNRSTPSDLQIQVYVC